MDEKRKERTFTFKLRLTEMAFRCLLRNLKYFLTVKAAREKSKLNKFRKKLKPGIPFERLCVISYIQKLPTYLIQELFHRLIRFEVGIEVHHVIPFIYDGQTEINMDFRSEEFNFQFFLEVCGCRMRHLITLQVPKSCYLSAAHCASLRLVSPHIKRLNLYQVDVGDDSMPILSTLCLEELDLTSTNVTDIGLKKLWGAKARTKLKLKILKVTNSLVSLPTHIKALQELPMLEDADLSCGLLFDIPKDFFKLTPLRLSTLELHDTYRNVERALKIAACDIPTITTITLKSDGYTPKMLTLMTYIGKLSSLTFKNGLFLENFYLSSCINTCFASLCEFTLYDFWNLWFNEGDCHVFTIVAMCPKLQKLTFAFCEGLTNQVASKMATLLRSSELKSLILNNCSRLGTYGVVCFMEIVTVNSCEIVFPTNGATEIKECDVEYLLKEADEKNIKLKFSSIF